MNQLKRYDRADYDPAWPHIVRAASKAIIRRGGEIAMMYSPREGFYIFPGGGIEAGEIPAEALIREVREETGMVVLPETIREFGVVSEARKDLWADEIYEEREHFYTCEVEDAVFDPARMVDDETVSGYRAVWVTLDEAIAANERDIATGRLWMEKITFVLKLLRDER